jgi:multicomponent Na+:H+ antiporter subunit E
MGSGDPGSWIIGLPAVLAAVWARHRLAPTPGRGLSLIGALRFLPVFFIESFKGGLDVAWRVLGPRLRVEPGLLTYRLSLGSRAARILFVDLVSLLPGTLSADLEDDTLVVHALDCRVDVAPELARLERHVARLFGERLPDQGLTTP